MSFLFWAMSSKLVEVYVVEAFSVEGTLNPKP